MKYEKLKKRLDEKFWSKWIVGSFPAGAEVYDNYLTLNFIDDEVVMADNKPHHTHPRYMINFFHTDQEESIDSFFYDNNLFFKKSMVYSQADNCYQSTYYFYLENIL